MRIAVDVMGGDHAPSVPVEAAVRAAEPGCTVVLVGPSERIEPLLGPKGEQAMAQGLLELAPASQVIGPEEPPVAALRQKRDSSIVVGLGLVGSKRADAFVSAGSTGALMAGAFREFGRIRGAGRPALASPFPSLGPGGRQVLFLDLGANADARPEHIQAHAVMGAVYADKVMGRANPSVGLLSNGTEASKGSELVKEAHRLLAATPGLNFAGNVEGRDIFAGDVDVVVTDGFTGNVVTKVVEGLVDGLFTVMKQEFVSNLRGKIGALLLVPAFRAVKRRLDYTEYGGAPFLGLAGACVKCHGSSNAAAVCNGIGVARRYVGGRVIEIVAEQLRLVAGSASGGPSDQDSGPGAGGQEEE